MDFKLKLSILEELVNIENKLDNIDLWIKIQLHLSFSHTNKEILIINYYYQDKMNLGACSTFESYSSIVLLLMML